MAQAQLHCVGSACPMGHTCVCDKTIDSIEATPLPSCELSNSYVPCSGRGRRAQETGCSSRQLPRELTLDSLALFNFLIEVELIYNIVFISAVQQSGSVMHMWTLFFYILFHYGLLQDIEYSSLCNIVGPCCLSIARIIIWI